MNVVEITIDSSSPYRKLGFWTKQIKQVDKTDWAELRKKKFEEDILHF
jgi:hypothetical protein